MQTFSTKAGKILGNLGQVGHSSYAPESGHLLGGLEGYTSFLGLT